MTLCSRTRINFAIFSRSRFGDSGAGVAAEAGGGRGCAGDLERNIDRSGAGDSRLGLSSATFDLARVGLTSAGELTRGELNRT